MSSLAKREKGLEKFVCRIVNPERDLPALREFMTHSFTAMGTSSFKKLLQELLSTSFASSEAFAAAYLRPNVSHFWVIEESDTGRLVGCVGAMRSNPFEVELVRMFVQQEFRRQGLGRRLVEHVVKFTREYGYHRVILHCSSESGQSLYLASGFRALCREASTHFFWKPVARMKISRVMVIGGVHGNELIGVHLITQRWKNNPALLSAGPECTVTTVIANPLAVERCVRFVDKDLNRCFALQDLPPTLPLLAKQEAYEIGRARELNALIGPKQDLAGSIASCTDHIDYLFDLHSTTSACGLCFMTLAGGNAFTLRLALYVREALKAANCPIPFHLVVDSCFPRTVNNNIESIPAHGGVCIEVGPLAHGTLNNLALLDWTAQVVQLSLNFIAAANSGQEPPCSSHSIEGYEMWKPIYFPRHTSMVGGTTAALHPSLIGRDFQPLCRSHPLFVDLSSGEVCTTYEEEEDPVFPMFIGEAAYFASGIAMWLCRRRTFEVYGRDEAV